ncbi:Triose-phosphate Transporter [Borealophlyctis nickersoniae]|nr:Triose-phosphate Transporter [Borealophlyctis nickersoniae]
MGILTFGGLIAFCMVISEFKLIAATSVVTFSVAGIAKEIVTIISAAIVFGDTFSANKIVGLCISIGGIAAYNYVRVQAVKKKLHGELGDGADGGGKHVRRSGDGMGQPLMGDGSEDDFEDDEGDDGDMGLDFADAGLFGYHPVTAAAVAAAAAPSESGRHRTSIQLDDVIFDGDGVESERP